MYFSNYALLQFSWFSIRCLNNFQVMWDLLFIIESYRTTDQTFLFSNLAIAAVNIQ